MSIYLLAIAYIFSLVIIFFWLFFKRSATNILSIFFAILGVMIILVTTVHIIEEQLYKTNEENLNAFKYNGSLSKWHLTDAYNNSPSYLENKP